jgi:hypothetical protein
MQKKRENRKLQQLIFAPKSVTDTDSYKYLLNLKNYMLIQDDINYSLIFFISFSSTF